ncbi:DUF7059 domain-containing protein [Acrocarpospora catenulata]|uniref:DUF7059 domain-containing protein n=1 Tax=Acrocarpospora catenulata TaxID=2836182 RepID=UPI001BDAFC26|nr:methyltransferase [Acrocarpospora catenulata]
MKAPTDLLRRLRDRFQEAGYTLDGVRTRLGDTAAAALAREELVPALRATRDADPLGTLIRLWWLGVPVSIAAVDLPLTDLIRCGLLVRVGDSVQAAVHLQPWETGGYLVSDRKVRPGDPALRKDHVVGAGGASANLAQLVTREPAGRALDLGTGCGVQVLHLAERAEEIVATDVNRRALDFARLSWELSGIDGVEARKGPLFTPVEDEHFDLIVANPPFVISPAGRYTYRESGHQADSFCADLVRQAPHHLNPGGHCQLLANWLHVAGEDWQDRVGGWLAGTGCDGWVVQREVQDPAEYVELWLRDAAEQGTHAYRDRYDEWLAWFDQQRVTGIGFGWITLRATGSLDPVVRVEELRHRVELPVGGHLTAILDGIAAAHRLTGDELLTAALRLADGVVEERTGPPGAEHPAVITLRQTRGLCRASTVGTVEAALAGVVDGQLRLGALLAAIGELTGEHDLTERAPDSVRALIAEGFFTAVTGTAIER